MGKDAYYFSHDANAQDDEKILDLRADYGWEGYGLYWAILELMRNQSDYRLDNGERLYKKLAMKFNVEADFMERFVGDCCEYGLFVKEDGKIYSESFLRRMEKYEKRKQAARKAAEARWDSDSNAEEDAEVEPSQCDRITKALRKQCDSNASKVNKSKVKESKLKNKNKEFALGVTEVFNTWKELLSDVNNARLTKKCVKRILAKIKKWSEDDLVQAIENYNEVYRSDYYYSHNFTLQKFVKQGNAAPRFQPGLDQENDGDIWKDYKNNHKKRQNKDVANITQFTGDADEYEY